MGILPSKLKKAPKSIDDIDFPDDYPSKEYYTHWSFVKQEQKEQLKNLIRTKTGEKDIDKCLTKNKPLWDCFFPHTGNHGIWVIPKQQIKTKIGNSRGLIPDYVICTKNSDGFQYWLIEIKGANEKVFQCNSNKEIYLTSETNKGICQLLEYIDYCSEYQSKLRDEFKFKNFREPKGILVIGTEEEFKNNEGKEKLKAAWNRNNPKLEIRTYSSILRRLEIKSQ